MESLHDHARGSALGELSRFRQEFYTSLTARADALFELSDAVLCADGPVRSLTIASPARSCPRRAAVAPVLGPGAAAAQASTSGQRSRSAASEVGHSTTPAASDPRCPVRLGRFTQIQARRDTPVFGRIQQRGPGATSFTTTASTTLTAGGGLPEPHHHRDGFLARHDAPLPRLLHPDRWDPGVRLRDPAHHRIRMSALDDVDRRTVRPGAASLRGATGQADCAEPVDRTPQARSTKRRPSRRHAAR